VNETAGGLSRKQVANYEMGRWAVEYVLRHQTHDGVDGEAPVQQLMHCPLVERDST